MPPSALHIQRARTHLGGVLAAKTLDAVARKTGLVRRERLVTASALFWSFMVTLGAQRMEFISDVLRTLNAREGWALRYKPFWNRLAQPAFARFMKAMFMLLCREVATRVMTGAKGSVAWSGALWLRERHSSDDVDPKGKSVEKVREIRDEVERRIRGMLASRGWLRAEGPPQRVDIRHGRCHAATGNAYVDSISADRVSKRPERIAARSVSMV